MATTENSSGNSNISGLTTASKPDDKTQSEEQTSESVNWRGGAMDTRNNSDPEVVLRQWRIGILNSFFTIAAIISVPALATVNANAVSKPDTWSIAISFCVIELFLIALAALRNLPVGVRVGGIWLIGYSAAILNLINNGLSGVGPLYLLVIPILILILMGKRAGFLTAVFSVLLAAAFAVLMDQNLIVPGLLVSRSPWMAFTAILMFLTLSMTLLILSYRFQERLIDKERLAQADLIHAQALLEEQNATLEQKIKERTGELQASYFSLEQRNAELALLDSVGEAMVKTLDVKTMTRLIGDKMREIFNCDSTLIMLLDRHTNLIHVPYEFDKNEGGYIDYVEPFPLGTGLSSKVITSGQPLMVGTLEEELASGAYFPPELIEKGSGFFSQSWLGVPIMAKEQVLGLVALADSRAQAFNEDHLSLLQTLSSNMGVAIENARLFQAEQQRVAELAIINSVQAGLASQLDMQAIYELVGDKIREIFDANTVVLATFDFDKGLIYRHYTIERGTRYYIETMPI